MTNILLDALGIEIDGCGYTYRDWGTWNDLHVAYQTMLGLATGLAETTGTELRSGGPPVTDSTAGYTGFIETPVIRLAISFYRNTGHKGFMLHTRGHEQTHVLQRLGCVDALREKIFEEYWISGLLLTDNIQDEETADVGGIYALMKRGHSPEFVKLVCDIISDERSADMIFRMAERYESLHQLV